MNMDQYRLMKVIEECAEVAQRAAKQQQFGRDEIQPGQALTNGERLRAEVLDLRMWLSTLEICGQIEPVDTHDVTAHRMGKQSTINKMVELAKKLGNVG